VFAWLKKLFRRKPKPVAKAKPRGQVQAGQERLIPLVNFSRSRRTRQALLSLEGLDPQSHNVIWNMQFMTDAEINGERKRWSDPY